LFGGLLFGHGRDCEKLCIYTGRNVARKKVTRNVKIVRKKYVIVQVVIFLDADEARIEQMKMIQE
jgi:hypothetical protein